MRRRIDPAVKAEARRLRSQGASLNRIATTVGVAKSTVSVWVREVPLADRHRATLDERVASRRRLGHLTWSRRCRAQRREAQLMGRAFARLGDADYNGGCMLYWAEGAKSRNSAIVANADAELLRFWIGWVDRWYDIPAERIALSVNCYLGNGLDVPEVERWWLDQLGLRPGNLRKAIVNRAPRSSNGVHRPLLHGTARVAIGSTFLVQSIYGALQEVGGFERPEWLDLGGVLPEIY